MGIFKTIIGTSATLVLLLAIIAGAVWHILSKPSTPPILPTQYWGPGEPKPDNPAIVPFRINISNQILNDLQNRLSKVPSLTPPLENANFWYGFNSDYLQEIVRFWLKEYKWREREVFLNKFPQFKTQVAGLNIHFIRVKPSKVPEGVQVLPLLLLHGWPGSVREFYDLIPLLTTPRANEKFVFEVIAPSLPGYGFSEGASKQGLGSAQMAVVLKSLMERLGFQKFYIQGGDWGAIIGSNLAALFPDNVLGFHSNFCVVKDPLALIKGVLAGICPQYFLSAVEASRFRSIGNFASLLLEEMGYFHLQATKPDTIGVALTSSPVGLAAYILEKFSTGTNADWRSLPDGGLTRKYTLTNLLDNVMIYWVSGSMTTAMRLYSEGFSKRHLALQLERAQRTVPTACARFPHEIDYTPEFILKDKFVNLVQLSDIPEGGHFAAFEVPQLLSEDIWTAINKMQNFNEKKV